MKKNDSVKKAKGRKIAVDILFLVLGVASAALGLKGFLLPNHFIDGGVMGVSLLVAFITGIPLAILVFCINLPFVILGWKQVSIEFAIKTFFSITLLAVALAVIDYPVITSDKVLISIFGGFFLGAGVGLSVRGAGVLDGTEVLALYVSKKSILTIGDVILVINLIIFSIAAFLLGIEPALYSILTYLAASRTVDFIVQGIEEYTGVTIVSQQGEDIRQALIEKFGRGVTVYKGKSGFGKRGHTQDVDILFSVVTRLEVTKLKALVSSIDETAFVVQHSINDTVGGMVKRRPLK
jgi:uncharacterized membrane-anchored protein YitT (DUF2179 family)